ncbi:MAG: threonine synthase [Verrucomicrobiota bacterium]
MKFISTRGQTEPHSFTEVVAAGLAPDGGLFIPESLPNLGERYQSWRNLDYPNLCAAFFKVFATDIEFGHISEMAYRAYQSFDHPEYAPFAKLDENTYALELFHGPTLAFKDFAMQFLGQLIEYQVKMSKRTVTILGATSGDTGAAAIQGLMGKTGVNVFILYPNGRISPLQERQMTCTGATNVFPIAIEGSFDDAQYALKDVFADADFRREVGLTTINSINIARILAQCVYYLYAYFRLPDAIQASDNLEWVVPTGNFGNILAGWLVQQMGVPIGSFRIATNQNDILHRLFSSCTYQTEVVQPSYAPSMDIQVASNFERFVYFAEKQNAARVREVMQTFRETGKYVFEDFDRSTFSSSRTQDSEIPGIIKTVFEKYRYTVDPHTACGFKDLDPGKTSIILSTAHPAKFPEVVETGTGSEPLAASLEALKSKEITNYRVEPDSEAIRTFIRNRLRPRP